MQRYILTGAPGAGKTTLIRRLADLGYPVVAEAATDVEARNQAGGVAQPHLLPDFIDQILRLQQSRRDEAAADAVQFHDRSPICTFALSQFLGLQTSAPLARELERIERERLYEHNVFFVENLGFIVNTMERRISFADALAFEAVHERAYRELGYALVRIAPGTVAARVGMLERWVASPS